jgi:hypothetical protein
MIELASVIFPLLLRTVLFVILYMVFISILTTAIDSFFPHRNFFYRNRNRFRQSMKNFVSDEYIREGRKDFIGNLLMIPTMLLTYVVWIQLPFVRSIYYPTPLKTPSSNQIIQNIHEDNNK